MLGDDKRRDAKVRTQRPNPATKIIGTTRVCLYCIGVPKEHALPSLSSTVFVTYGHYWHYVSPGGLSSKLVTIKPDRNLVPSKVTKAWIRTILHSWTAQARSWLLWLRRITKSRQECSCIKALLRIAKLCTWALVKDEKEKKIREPLAANRVAIVPLQRWTHKPESSQNIFGFAPHQWFPRCAVTIPCAKSSMALLFSTGKLSESSRKSHSALNFARVNSCWQ